MGQHGQRAAGSGDRAALRDPVPRRGDRRDPECRRPGRADPEQGLSPGCRSAKRERPAHMTLADLPWLPLPPADFSAVVRALRGSPTPDWPALRRLATTRLTLQQLTTLSRALPADA